jgi:hypothetical protein
MEIISTRKVGKRVSPSREFTEYIGNETGNGFAGQNGAGNGFAGQNGAGNSFAGQNGARNAQVRMGLGMRRLEWGRECAG